MGVSWNEGDFRRWLILHPVVPGTGPLTFVGSARQVERQIDLVFIAADGALVLVEVKNERTTREVIGQALEYAARLEKASLETIADLYCVDVAAVRALADQRFGRQVTLSSKRHLVFVAPEFDVTCHVTIPYLRYLATDKGVSFHLTRAIQEGDGFRLMPDIEPVLASAAPAGFCGVSHHGTCYVVLEPGIVPILWRVGTVDDGVIMPASRPALRQEDKLLFPFTPAPEQLSLSSSGSFWTKRSDPEKTAVILGRLGQRSGGTYCMARFKAGQLTGLKRKGANTLHEDWEPSSPGKPDWRRIALGPDAV